MPDQTRRTMLALHAHPDDEALLTSGTMARAAAEGHRVILVVATDGELGLASEEYAAGLGARRTAELQRSAQALGVARVEQLGYADSGLGPELLPDPSGRTRFVRADTEEAAARVAAILREEQVDVLLGYDANGGYGHPDHVKLHHVARRAAVLAGTPLLLEATVPRDTICRALDLAAKVYRFPPEFDRASFDRAFSARSEITHRINVRRHIRAKRASMRAHASQASADGGADRTLAAFLRIPRPLYDLVFGREWFVDATAAAHAENCTLDAEKCTLDSENCTLDSERCTVDSEKCTVDRGDDRALDRGERALDGAGVSRPSGIRRDVFEGLR